MRTCRFTPDGHRQLTGFFFPGDVFGLETAVRRTSAETVSDVVLRRHGQPRLASPAPYDPAMFSDLGSGLGRALESAEDRILLFGLRTAAERVAAFLLMMADRSSLGVDVCLPMSRSDIADYLGLTVETVSRTFSQFVRARLIQLRGPHQFRILDRPRLCRAGGSAATVAEDNEVGYCAPEVRDRSSRHEATARRC